VVLMDQDGDDAVDKTEFVIYIRDYLFADAEKFDATMEKMMAHAQEFKTQFHAKQLQAQTRIAKFTAIFDAWDMDEQGTLDMDEIQMIAFAMHSKGEWNNKRTKYVMRQMDKDGDGQVNLKEFLEFYKVPIFDLPEDRFQIGLDMFSKVTQFSKMANASKAKVEAEQEEDEAAKAAVEKAKEAVASATDDDSRAVAELQLDQANLRLSQDLMETENAKSKQELVDKVAAAAEHAAQNIADLQSILEEKDTSLAMQEAQTKLEEAKEGGNSLDVIAAESIVKVLQTRG